MPIELTNEILRIAGGACALGVILTAIVSKIGNKRRSNQRDPRDAKIRGLEAELRVAKASHADTQVEHERLLEELKETSFDIESRDTIITRQQMEMQQMATELKQSLKQTQKLRVELAERAEENLHAEARIREVQTELSVVQASNDMIATGALEFDVASNESSANEFDSEQNGVPGKVGESGQ